MSLPQPDDAAAVPAHQQAETHHYIVHYPPHPPRKGDPHYADFDAYHRKTRATARCYIGERVGFGDCRDEHGSPCPPPGHDMNMPHFFTPQGPVECPPNCPAAAGEQPGLELHHAHIEFALQNGISLTALEKDYPGVSDPSQVGAWVESGANFRWLCTFHHRAAGGAHTASHSDWEGSQYLPGLITKG